MHGRGRRWSASVTTGALVACLLSGCATPALDRDRLREPALREIHSALEDAVDWAHASDELAWTSGWTGNAVALTTDDATVGLCYDWQQLVWEFTRPAASRVGWSIDGIAINEGTWTTHYAVVVWDPTQVDRASLLEQPASAPVYVLDAWRNGRAEVYPLAEWIDIPIIVLSPPVIENLAAVYGDTPRFTDGGSAIPD